MFCDRLHAWLLIQSRLIITRAVGDSYPFRIVLGQAYRGLTGGFLLLRIFSVAISLFVLS